MKAWVQDLILGLILLAFSIISFVYAFIMQDTKASYFLARADTYILLWDFGIVIPAFNYPQRQKAFSGGGSNYSFQTGMCNAGYHCALFAPNELSWFYDQFRFVPVCIAGLLYNRSKRRHSKRQGAVQRDHHMAHNYCYYRFCCAVSFRLSAGSTASGGFLGLIT